MIKVKEFEIGQLPWIIWMGSTKSQVLKSREPIPAMARERYDKGQRDSILLMLKMEKQRGH